MISISYVNKEEANPILFDSYINTLNNIDSIMESVTEAKYEYESAYADYLLESEFLEADDDSVIEKNGIVAEKRGNFIEKIGQAIINIFKSAYDFILDIINKIKEKTSGLETDLDKISALQKKHPGLADDIKVSFETGKLNVKDAKSIAELEKEYSEIMKMAQKADVTPGSLEDKWNRAKEKFKEHGDTIIKAGQVITGVTTILLFASKIAEAKNSIAKAKQCTGEENAKAYVRGIRNGNIENSDGVATTLLKITRERNRMTVEQCNAAGKLIWKFNDTVASIKDKMDKTDVSDFHNKMSNMASDYADDAALKHENLIKAQNENRRNP